MKPIQHHLRRLAAMACSTVAAVTHLHTVHAALPNPVVFVTQVPLPREINGTVSGTALSVVSLFGNAQADTASAGRGGDLMLMLPSGGLVNLTRKGGYGVDGVQHTHGIAVRDPHIHWSGGRMLFSMVVGAPKSTNDTTAFFWQLYELSNLDAVIANTNLAPVITRVPNQPAQCNNVSPCYATDDRIIFMSDRPYQGQDHLYPPLEEYKGHATVAGSYSLDPATGDLQQLQHLPSGAFNPFIDSFGRLIETRWDHLVQDSNATDDRLGRAQNGSFNYASEAANAVSTPTSIETFPEPRNYDTNQISLLGVRGNAFNQFLPWMLSERGGGEELINHWGRQEFNTRVDASFVADTTLLSITNLASRFSTGVSTINTNNFNNLLQISEDPLNPGVYLGVDAPDFSPFGGTHAAGQIISIAAGPNLNPTQMTVRSVTPKSTAGPNSFGIYRNPLPLSDGGLVAAFTPAVSWDTNLGTLGNPNALYRFRLVTLKTNGDTWTTNQLLTAGIPNSARYFDGSTLVTHSGTFWELQPVEVRARTRPQAWNPPIDAVEAAVFQEEGVDLPTFQSDLKTRGMALVISRNVTARDAADKQQPFNLRIPGGAQSLTGNGGKTYDITHLQFLQADYLRGYGMGTTTPVAGRRVLATPQHGVESFNLSSSKASPPPGGTELMSDGSQATFVNAGRATTWQLTGLTNESIVKERYWVTFKPGEVRTCANCHGINARDQLGRTTPTNAPLALRQILRLWRTNSANAYTLTVNSGSGSGSYGAGSVLSLTANPPAPGTAFAGWSGAGISQPASSTSAFIMPAAHAAVTATYTNLPPPVFTLTVVNGSGSGSYVAGTVVAVSANNPPPGQAFLQWTGAAVANPVAPSTFITMPATPVTLTATYQNVAPPTFPLTVNSGTGSGAYTAGTLVPIAANSPPSGMIFDQWIGSGIASALAPQTTVLMPAAALTVTATYKPAPLPFFTLTVNQGSGGGSYNAGTLVTLTANPPAPGWSFDQWLGPVNNSASPTTTLTMPAANTTATAIFEPFGLLTNHPPAALPQSLNITANTATPITLSGTDPDGDTLRLDVAHSPLFGTLSGTPPTITYTPSTGFVGADYFTFTATDGLFTSPAATVSLNVVPAGTVNTPPATSLTSPIDGTSAAFGTDLTLAATASDADGVIVKVAFYVNGVKLGESTSAPYAITLSNVPAGRYVIAARAFDNAGGRSFSAPVMITVTP